MGSAISQEADTQQQSEVSPPTQPVSQTDGENHNYKKSMVTTTSEAILKDADTAIDTSSIDQLYAGGVFLNKKRKKYWVDKVSNGNCFFLFARELSITWGEDIRYWHWPYIKETSEVVDVAEMLDVCWLEVNGKFEMSKLTPGIKYEVVFVVMLKDPAYGWEVPINIRLILPDASKQEHQENFMEKPRCKWFEIPVGEFMVEPKKEGCLQFSMYEYHGGAWKKGLLVKGAVIRPKN